MVVMADDTSNKPYPFQFDPSQWSNPYSQFYGKALPFPPTYAGTPTDALGQPIAVPQGMTLNNTPAQPQAPAPAAPQQQPVRLATTSEGMPPGETSLGRGVIGGSYQPNAFMGPQQQQPQQAPMAAAPAGNNWQTTLAMLANPGHVTTPGATVPQAAPGGGQPSPGVLQNFLANWQPAQSGPGSGFTQNFNQILRGLQAQKGS
jgi:hypothetical protein